METKIIIYLTGWAVAFGIGYALILDGKAEFGGMVIGAYVGYLIDLVCKK